jgi:ribosomal protein S18 acetylase RimI-like enzyme
MDETRTAEAAADNFATHVSWAPSRIRGMRVAEDDGLLLVDSGLASDTFNVVCRSRLPQGSAAKRVREAIDHFRRERRTFSWWTAPGDRPEGLAGLLVENGLRPAEVETACGSISIGCRSGRPLRASMFAASEPRPSSGAVARVTAANAAPRDAAVERYFRLAAPFVLANDSPLSFFLGYLAGEPVAAAEITAGESIAGLYGLSTIEAFRGRGFGGALTLAALREARAAGRHTAVLQAAPAGAGLYRRIGFAPFGEIVEYKPASREDERP